MARRRAKLSVLHVDDDPAVRRAVARILGGAGFRVASEPDGPAGLAAARAIRPDLVILDVDLPGLSGFEVCVRLRADSATRRLPVLHLSAARIDVRDRVQGLEGGADAYLVQPVEPAELVAVAHALARRGARRPDPRRTTADAWDAREDTVRLAAQLLRAPLSVIAINASGLADGSDDPVGRARAQAVLDAHGAAARALAELAELAFLDSRAALLPLEGRTPRQLVDAAVERLGRARDAVAPRVDVPDEPALRCDPGRVEAALAALLERAVDATGPAGARIGARREGDAVHFQVEGGAPATEEERALLQQSFWSVRGRRPQQRVPALALVRAVVQAHRGQVWFDVGDAAVHLILPTSPIVAS